MDLIDGQFPPEVLAKADGFIACSAMQSRYLRTSFPGRPVIHIPHHVDLDIPGIPCQWDHFACGYFGDPNNACHLKELENAGEIAVWEAKTSNKNGWYQALPAANLHYAFRPRSMWGSGFKPFTKGFIAAHVNAVIMVAESDDEATELLGSDYPMRLPDSSSAQDVLDKLAALRADFGGEVWQMARQRMNRLRTISSAAYIKNLIRSQFFEESSLSDFMR